MIINTQVLKASRRGFCRSLIEIVFWLVLLFGLIVWVALTMQYISQDDNNQRFLKSEVVLLKTLESHISASLSIPTTIPVISKSNMISTILVVLGNEPLDDNTPTVDTMKRVELAASYQMKHPDSLIIFTGGPTAGKTTEAQMMSNYAMSLGVPANKIKLEEKARSTGANAKLVAKILIDEDIHAKEIFVVSKNDHLKWAMSIFKGDKVPGKVFKDAKPLGINVDKSESMKQMESYLKTHDSKRVKMRLENLRKGIQGID